MPPPPPPGFELVQPATVSAPRTLPEEAGRQVGLAGRYALTGPAGVLDLAGNVGAAALNAPFVAWDAIRGNEPGTSEPFRYGDATRAAEGVADAAGLPRPQGTTENLVRAGSEALTGGGLGNLAARGAAQVPRAATALDRVLESVPIRSAPEAGWNALAGVGGLVGGQAGQAVVPDNLRPLGAAVGSLAGGAGAVVVPSAAMAGGRAGVNALARYAEPFLPAGQERMAANRLASAATDLPAARDAVSQGSNEIIPGSRPTTGQQTGDMGILALERGLETARPAEFNARRAEQDVARGDAVNEFRRDGDPLSVPQLFRRQLDELNAESDRVVGTARGEAESASAAFGGRGSPETAGRSMREAGLQAEDAARQVEGRLWQAVDPDGTLALDVVPIREAARSIVADQTPSARPMSPAERQIFGVAESYPDVRNFQEIVQLRSNVSAAMREELRQNGRSPSYGRLSRFRGSLEDALETAVERQIQREATEGVPAGQASIDTLVRDWVSSWYDERQAQNAVGTRGFDGAGSPGFAAGRSAGVPGARVPAGDFRGEYGNRRGGGGPPGEGEGGGLTPNFTADAADRLRVASDATRDRAQRFQRGPVGEILRRGETADSFAVAAGDVPGRIFRPGAASAERIRSYRDAVGDEQALPLLEEAAALSLRRAASRPDGTMDPAKVQRWLAGHSEAMGSFPDLAQRFSRAGAAEERVAEVSARMLERQRDFERSAASRFLRLESPEGVTQAIGSMFGSSSSVRQFGELHSAVQGDPAALAGVKRAIAEHIATRLTSNREAGTTSASTLRADQFQTFIRQNQRALSSFFNEGELRTLNAIALDLQQANRSNQAVRLPGRSNTAQDIEGQSQAVVNHTLLRQLMTASGGALAGAVVGGPVGAAATAAGGAALQYYRQMGIRRAEDILVAAMLDPAQARALLAKATPQNSGRLAEVIGARLARAVTAAEAEGHQNGRAGPR